MKRWMIACVLAVTLLLLIGCQQPRPAAQKKAPEAEKAAPAELPVEEVKPVDVDSLPEPEFALEYCNKRISDTRNDLQGAQDNLADEQDDLKDLQAQPKSEDRDDAIANTQDTIKSLTAEVSSLQRGLTSMESKCKKPSASVCAEFTADASEELADLRQELLNEQKELDYIQDPKKQDLQRRKLLLLEKRIEEWTAIGEELKAECK